MRKTTDQNNSKYGHFLRSVFYVCFSRFLNCANVTKSRNASHIQKNLCANQSVNWRTAVENNKDKSRSKLRK